MALIGKNNIPLKELAIIENICGANFKYYKLKRFLTNKVSVNKIIYNLFMKIKTYFKLDKKINFFKIPKN